jgi:hypothetical protein
MEGFGVSLTPGVTMHFGSLGSVYNGPAKSVVGNLYTRPAHPTTSTMTARCAAFIRSFTGEMVMAMLGPNPTKECFTLAAYYLTDLAIQASGSKSLTWGEFMEWYSTMYPNGQ